MNWHTAGPPSIALGDDTPVHTGHMTVNPLVHMGPMSIAALLIVGIAWGAMPVSPHKLRGRYADALVSVAGPVTNLLLTLIALTILGVWMQFSPAVEGTVVGNVQFFFKVFGATNILLFMFNLFPVPPLDGSRILANFHRGYASFISDPSKQGVMMLAFVFTWMICSQLWYVAYCAAYIYIDWIQSVAAMV